MTPNAWRLAGGLPAVTAAPMGGAIPPAGQESEPLKAGDWVELVRPPSGRMCEEFGLALGGVYQVSKAGCGYVHLRHRDETAEWFADRFKRVSPPPPVILPAKKESANAVQVGGDHYKAQTIQPWDAIVAWGLGFLDGNVVKYVARFRKKGGIEDLKKARHYLDKLIEVSEAKP